LLRRTMGCARLVYNRALAARTEAWYERYERVGYKETNAMLTEWKKQEDLQFLNEVSCVPLQQGLRHLQKAFSNFFEGRAKYPNFKKKHHGGNAEFTLVGFPMEKRTGISSEMCPSIGDPLESRAAQRSPTIHNYGQPLALWTVDSFNACRCRDGRIA